MNENQKHAPMPKRRPGGGHGMGKMMPGERAKNFRGTLKNIIDYMGGYKFAVLVVIVFAAASTVFSVAGPKVMGLATTELAEGLMNHLTVKETVKITIENSFSDLNKENTDE